MGSTICKDSFTAQRVSFNHGTGTNLLYGIQIHLTEIDSDATGAQHVKIEAQEGKPEILKAEGEVDLTDFECSGITFGGGATWVATNSVNWEGTAGITFVNELPKREFKARATTGRVQVVAVKSENGLIDDFTLGSTKLTTADPDTIKAIEALGALAE